MGLNAKDKLIRARIDIQNRNPFFAYLSLYLKYVESKSEDLDGNGAGIDADGNLHYDPKWIESLDDEECVGLILHEIMHLSFLHLLRRGNRHPFGWNICTDIAVNKIIIDNNFSLPSNGIIPEGNEITLFGQTIYDLDKKPAEVLFDEFKQQQQPRGSGKGKGKGKGEEDNTPGFDKHMEGKQMSPDEVKEMENKWLNRIEEAYVGAKMRGQVPEGIERLIGKLHESRVNWKSLLQRYVMSYIPYDQCYSKPNKKSRSVGFYMPDYVKEKIKVAIAIDTSGSIGQKELTDFLSEIVGLSRAYQNRIDMRLICHDVEVHEDLKVDNGNIEKIKQLKAKGGGGTSHSPVFKYIEQNIPDCKVAIFFTDGDSDLEKMDFKERFAKIFLISEGGTDRWADNKQKHCKVIRSKRD